MLSGETQMKKNVPPGPGLNNDELVRCSQCAHFQYFETDDQFHANHALGRCTGAPWDSNQGQWAMFRHHCKAFVKRG